MPNLVYDMHNWDEVEHIDKLHFFYDAQSRPAKVSYNGVIYSGPLVVEYQYDAWGKAISMTGSLAETLGKRNPFRYRGYIYDEETGLYYLRSRYYNPTVGRFVNADTVLQIGLLAVHSFAYCANNPMRRTDSSGCAWYDVVAKCWNDFWNAVGDEIKRQAEVKMGIDIRIANRANEVLSSAGAWIKKTASDAGKAASSWVKDEAVPWVEQAWADTKRFVRDSLRAQQQADILSAQMTYHAASKIGNWLSQNWKDVVDWAGIGFTGASFALNKAAKAGIIVIAPWVGVAMTVTEYAFWIYSIGDKLEVW